MRRHLKTKFDRTRAADDSRGRRDFPGNDRSASLQWCDLNDRMSCLHFVRMTNLAVAVMKVSSCNLNRLSRYIQKDYS